MSKEQIKKPTFQKVFVCALFFLRGFRFYLTSPPSLVTMTSGSGNLSFLGGPILIPDHNSSLLNCVLRVTSKLLERGFVSLMANVTFLSG